MIVFNIIILIFLLPTVGQAQPITNQKDACIQTDTDSVLTAVSKTIHNSRTHTSLQKTKKLPRSNKENETFVVPRPTESVHLTMVSKPINRTQASTQRTQTLLEDKEKNKPKKINDGRISTEIIEIRPNKEQKIATNAEVKLNEVETVINEVNNGDTVQSRAGQLVKHRMETQVISEEDNIKELIIVERDVLLLRHYIETHKTDVDLYRFDADDNYKMYIFFTINPLVRIERCPRIAQMLKDRDAHATVHFARQLGLRTIDGDRSDIKQSKNKRKSKRGEAKRSRQDVEVGTTRYRYANFTDSEIELRTKKIPSKVRVTITCKENNKYGHRKIMKNTNDLSQDSETEEQRKKYFKKAKVSKTLTDDSGTDQPNENNNKTAKKVSTSRDICSDVEKEIQRRAENYVKEVDIKLRNIRKRKAVIGAESDVDRDSSDRERRTKKEREVVTLTTDSSDSEAFEQSKLRSRKAREGYKRRKENSISNVDIGKRRFEKAFADRSPSKAIKQARNNDSDEEIYHHKNKKKVLRRGIAVPKRSSVPPGREYTPLEDQAIVAWLSTSTQRERSVNGNRVWKSLEQDYTGITGQRRSWHSLRNRYLRYILPSLGDLALPAAQAQRLRVHATLGELKSHKSRRNSVFRLPAVRSASARAPLRLRKSSNSSENSEAASPKLRLRSSAIELVSKLTNSTTQSLNKAVSNTQSSMQSPNKTVANTQSHSKASKIKAQPRTRSSNKTDTNTQSSTLSPRNAQSPNKAASRPQSPSKRITRASHSPRSSPTYSELTRRFALRNRSTPHQSPIPAQEHHKRRLYNP